LLGEISEHGSGREAIKNQVQECAESVGVLGSDPELHDEDQHELDSAGNGQN